MPHFDGHNACLDENLIPNDFEILFVLAMQAETPLSKVRIDVRVIDNQIHDLDPLANLFRAQIPCDDCAESGYGCTIGVFQQRACDRCMGQRVWMKVIKANRMIWLKPPSCRHIVDIDHL